MNFNGAVKVDNEKLHKFVQVWDKTLQQYNLAEEQALEWADVEFEKLNWLKKWLYKNEDNKVFKVTALYKEDGKYFGMFCTFDKILMHLGFLPDLSRWSDLFWKKNLAGEIKSLVKCGGPVYLNPAQAKLVEDFINMEDIEL